MAQTLRRVEGAHLVPRYDSLQEALDAARARPRHLREELRLAPIPTAAAVARLLRKPTPQVEAEGGRGLWLVEQLTQAWGVRPYPDGGKVVWCALTL